MTATTPTAAYREARMKYRLQRTPRGWRLVTWRQGLASWEAGCRVLCLRDAVQERAAMVVAHALLLLGIPRDRAAHLVMTFDTGRARDRIADAYHVERAATK